MIRVGLVGFGLAGKAFHAPVISAVEGLELAAVVERSTQTAADAYPGIALYLSLAAMLTDSTLELIVIATPTATHLPLALQALEAGRHVVVDKPAGVTSAEIAQLIDCAKAEEKLLIPFHNRRWDSDFQTLQKLLLEQKLGRVVAFESTFERWRPIANPTAAWRESDSPGSGILLDLGTHQVDQALLLFGLPQAVSADIDSERDGAVAVDFYNVRLHYPRCIATITGNNLTAIPRPHFAVRGTRGNYVKWGLDPQENRLRQAGRIIEPGWGTEPVSAWGMLAVDADGNMVTHPVQPIPGDYRLFYSGVRDAIQNKSAAPVAPIDAWRTARVLEWAIESSHLGQQVPCDWAETPETL
jgi:predicted dehydrogenase